MGINDKAMQFYRLGLDIGSNSIGWAMIAVEKDRPQRIERCGVRVFPAGVEGSLEQAKEESRATKRRQMRLQRRQTNRRRRRDQKVFNLLQSWGLLPAIEKGACRMQYFNALDCGLTGKYNTGEHSGLAHLPYFLRARALDYKLEPFELGRALYHLSQRRGFLSNRKTQSKESEEERGKVKAGIAKLNEALQASGARTMGEYFSRLDPLADPKIRGCWTARAMYLDEFRKIWSAQSAHHAELLTDTRRDLLFEAIFRQRPLRDQSELIGDCELVAGQKRAPLWHPLSQRFRLLQAVNDLRIVDPAEPERDLSEEDRRKLIGALESEGDQTWPKIRKLLGLNRAIDFNRERGGEKQLVGNRTACKLRGVFLHEWDGMSAAERLDAATALANEPEETLYREALARWGLNELQAREYSELRLEEGKYLGYSLAAIDKLLPHMEAGEAFMTARKSEFPETFAVGTPVDYLPPVTEAVSDIRNPAVLRALTELRRVVNAIIRQYGKPQEIHIELARDLKQARPERERRWKNMRHREAQRKQAAERLQRDAGIQNPSSADIEKMMLALECRFQCPYTGRQFSYAALGSGEVQVEHIIPFSRSLENSYANKTLCYADENLRKCSRTPWEHYGKVEHPDWDAILDRVAKFDSPLAKEKLRRFQMREEEVAELLSKFSERQLNDTRYATKLAAKYLAVLFGGLWDESYGRRVYATAGQMTADLRRLWSLNHLLSGTEMKSRDTHRHHALDAIVVALTDPAWIKALADAAGRASAEGRRRFASIEKPWPRFVEESGKAVTALLVSHRPDRSIGGGFHDETLYGKRTGKDGKEVAVVRKPVTALSEADFESIIDETVKERVRLQFGIVGGKAEKFEGNWPTLPTRDGRHIPIRRVRVEVGKRVRALAKGARQRYVMGGDNQHLEVFAILDNQGATKKWDCAIVSKQDAAERVRGNRQVVNRDHGPGTRFEFTISKNDVLEIGPPERRRLVVVKILTGEKRVGVVEADDARQVSPKVNLERYAVNSLMGQLRCRKVAITPLGELIPCRD